LPPPSVSDSAGDGLGIREAALRSGVTASALRYYETIGLIPAPPRSSGRRRYDPAVLDLILVITNARRAGFTLAEVAELLGGMTAGSARGSWRALALRKLPEVDGQLLRLEAVRTLLMAVSDCRCRDITECANLLREVEGPAEII